jgi:hypothetical protein
MLRQRAAVIALLAALSGCGRSAPSPEGSVATSGDKPADAVDARSADEKPRSTVHASFQNVHLHIAAGVVLEVRHLEGELVPKTSGGIPAFDDRQSFTLRIETAELAMTPASLTRLLNDHVFAYEKSPLTGLSVSIDKGRLKQKGTLHKGVAVPFTVTAELSATGDGRIRLHPVDVKTAGIPSEGLMKLFGLELDDLIKSNRARGFEIRDDDFFLAPDHLIPEPAVQGRLTAARIEGDRIVEVFGKPGPSRPDEPGNYMYYRGGTLRFGKLTMADADLRLIDADPRDPFDFSPPEYQKQLVAGYSKNTPRGGLRVFMPDFGKVAGADLRPAMP